MIRPKRYTYLPGGVTKVSLVSCYFLMGYVYLGIFHPTNSINELREVFLLLSCGFLFFASRSLIQGYLLVKHIGKRITYKRYRSWWSDGQAVEGIGETDEASGIIVSVEVILDTPSFYIINEHGGVVHAPHKTEWKTESVPVEELLTHDRQEIRNLAKSLLV